MAIGTAFQPVDMLDRAVWFGTLIESSATRIEIRLGDQVAVYNGNFIYGPFGSVSGTLNKVTEWNAQGKLYEFSGFSADAGQVFDAVQLQGNWQLAASLMLSGDDTLFGSSGDDTVFGHTGNDIIKGNGGNDELRGWDGNDRLLGNAGADVLKGERGNDILKGGRGDDTLIGDLEFLDGGRDKLFGDAGNDNLSAGDKADRLFGGNGRDRLDGGNGKDRLDGGNGNDNMTGGGGADTFIFSAGNDIITDFNATNNREKVDLSGVSSITGFRDLKNNHTTDVGGDLVISDTNGNTLTLNGLTIADLDSGDFIF